MAYNVSVGNNFYGITSTGASFSPSGSTLFVQAAHNSVANAAAGLWLAWNNNGVAPGEFSASLYFRGDVANDPLQFRWIAPTGTFGATNSTAPAPYVVNTGYALGAKSLNAAGSNALYVDTTKQPGPAASGTLASFIVDRVSIGSNSGLFSAITFVEETVGPVSKAAFWNVALTDDEMVSLGRGFSPRRVRPESLIFYFPLVRETGDLMRNYPLIQRGSPTVAPHPRSYGI